MSKNKRDNPGQVMPIMTKIIDDVFTMENDLHILEKATVRECIRVFNSIIGPVNEYRTGTSALDTFL